MQEIKRQEEIKMKMKEVKMRELKELQKLKLQELKEIKRQLKELEEQNQNEETGGSFFEVAVCCDQPYAEEADLLDDFGEEFYFVVPHHTRKTLLSKLSEEKYSCLAPKFRHASKVGPQRWQTFTTQFKVTAQVVAMRDLIRDVPGVYVFGEDGSRYKTLEKREITTDFDESLKFFVNKIK